MKRKFSLFVTIVVCLLLVVGILSACNDDSEQDPGVHVHSMELIAAKGATCTEGGNNAYYHCSGCNKYFKDEAGTQETTVEAETIPAAGHNWDNGEITTAATCTTDGVMTYTCLDCAETKIETSPALGHGMTIIKAKDATCTEAGNNAYYHCTRCNKYFKDIEGEEETTVEAETISARHKIVDGKCTICGKLYTVGLKYSLGVDGAYYIVTGIGTASGDIIIPDTHEGLPVKEIGDDAFLDCSSLTSIEIPAGVTSIGYEAFFGCSSLTDVSFAEGSQLTSIGSYAFYGCSSLTSIEIPVGVTSIGSLAFDGCSNLTSIEIPAGVTSIGDRAFYGCSNLNTVYYSGSIENWFNIEFEAVDSNPLYNGADLYIGGELVTAVVVPESVTAIGDYQFDRCTSLTSITIHSGVTSIGYYAFYDCINLESVTFAEGSQLTSIGSYAFYDCSSLTSIEIPAGVTSIGELAFSGYSNLESVTFAEGSQLTSIGDYTFYECGSLTSIEIPAGVTGIGSNAFSGCSSLTSIEIPVGVTSIGEYAFYGCRNLVSVSFAEGSQLTNIGREAFCGCSSLTSIEIPSGVTSIGYAAFRYCSNLESVTFAEGSKLTSIGSYAFRDCSSLKSIEIPAGVTELPDGDYYYGGVFSGCSSLESVTFAEGSRLTSIGERAFYGCSRLASIEIPTGVTSIGSNAFCGCSSLTSIEIPAGVTELPDGYSIDGVFSGCSNLASVTFAEGSQLTSIGSYAFQNCSSLTSIKIPAGVTSIGSSAFFGCSSLTSMEIPAGVTELPNGYCHNGCYGVFSGCSSLESVSFAEGSLLTSIGDYAFYYCSSLTSIEILAGVTSIGRSAFSGCSSLTGVSFAEGSELTSIGSSAFYYCSSLTSIEIPAGVTSIGDYAFNVCSNLASVTFAEGSQLTSIGSGAFYGCSSLTSIEIPAGVTSIGGSAFHYSYLTIVYNYSDLEITAGSGNYGYVAYYAEVVLTEDNLANVKDENGYITYTDGEKVLLLDYLGSEKDIVIPEGVTRIAKYAFYEDDIVSVTLPGSLTGIGDWAFNGCYTLKEVYNNSALDITAGSYIYGNVAEYAVKVHNSSESESIFDDESGFAIADGVLYGYRGSATNIIIPETVTSVAEYAFAGNDQIISVSIPSGVTSIGWYAFLGCSNLVSVTFAEGSELTSIGGYAFSGCSNLTSIEIPAGVTSIGDGAFYECSNLENVTFAEGSKLTSIENNAFNGCSSLETIYYNGTAEQWNAIVKGWYWDYDCGNYDVVFLGDAGAGAES